jgi:pimeloyl-ACP methyl ester carboxylesterase
MRWFWLMTSLTLFGQFDYDRSAPLQARQEPMAERPKARLWGGSFAGARGARVPFVLVEPKMPGRHPGVLFHHGGRQSTFNYMSEALILAELGVTSLLVDAEGASSRETLVDLVVTQRRALDLLLQQVGVDMKRIAYVGHSYGGAAGGLLAGVEPRIAAFVLIGAIPSLARHIKESKHSYWATVKSSPDYERRLAEIAEVDPERFLPRVRAAVFVQCALFDTPDNVRACPEVHRLAGGPKRLTWYEEDHNFTSVEAMRDRLYWLDSQLNLRGVGKVLKEWVRRK